jgi:hypothetical protein
MGNHHSKTANIKGIDGARNTPPGPHEHTTCRNSLVGVKTANPVSESSRQQ